MFLYKRRCVCVCVCKKIKNFTADHFDLQTASGVSEKYRTGKGAALKQGRGLAEVNSLWVKGQLKTFCSSTWARNPAHRLSKQAASEGPAWRSSVRRPWESSQQLQAPPLVQLSLIKRVEDHLVFIVLMPTWKQTTQQRSDYFSQLLILRFSFLKKIGYHFLISST